MARLNMPRIRRLSRKEWISASLVGGFMLVYFIGLSVLDKQAETYFRETRDTNPELYLEQLRDLHGFNAFLPEYAVLNKFDNFTPRTPEFLIGRWTMRDAPIRQVTGAYPEQCPDQITVDYGTILTVEPERDTLPVSYKIEDGLVNVNPARGEPFTIETISFGAQVDHIEFVPPGRDTVVYAYFCGG
ncbi:MAG: hypothetical protein P8X43_08735 [Maritimibacter sp.]